MDQTPLHEVFKTGPFKVRGHLGAANGCKDIAVQFRVRELRVRVPAIADEQVDIRPVRERLVLCHLVHFYVRIILPEPDDRRRQPKCGDGSS